MDARLRDLRSTRNRHSRIKILEGHFATPNSHVNTYIDMSTVKVRHNNARETASVLVEPYMGSTLIDTIVCMEETEVIATFMAEKLADSHYVAVNKGKNISVVRPEYDQIGQMMFRDNTVRMIENQQVLLLAASVTTGRSVRTAIESILYYGGSICGISAIFSAVNKIAGMDINTIFTSKDVPNYRAYPPHDCPMCKEGRKIEAIVNSYGYSKL